MNEHITDDDLMALPRFAEVFYEIKKRIDLETEMLVYFFGSDEWTPEKGIRIAMWRRKYLREVA
jgi:hypothetical protein